MALDELTSKLTKGTGLNFCRQDRCNQQQDFMLSFGFTICILPTTNSGGALWKSKVSKLLTCLLRLVWSVVE